jgi:hypothetical protein
MSRKKKSHLKVLPGEAAPPAAPDEQARLAEAQARLSAVVHELRAHPERLYDVEPVLEDGAAWAEAVAASEAIGCIPDLHASVSRVRARLREHIQSDPTS